MNFEEKFNEFMLTLTKVLHVPNSSDWSVRGFIDCYRNIYSISTDTKVISKIIELMIFPRLLEFARENNLELKLPPHQNYYPDITFIDSGGKKYAVDLKSTYRLSSKRVNGMTLGAFTGYFRNRKSNKNTFYPYDDYEKHYVFGIIYSRADTVKVGDYLASKGIIGLHQAQKKLLISYIDDNTVERWDTIVEEFKPNFLLTDIDRKVIDSYLIKETAKYDLGEFGEMPSVVMDFDLFIQEKWKIALDRPGSGNTKNIGSEVYIDTLKKGNGLFAREFEYDGKSHFDNYWSNYQTRDMARSNGRDKPLYNNVSTYKIWIDSLK